MVLWHKNTIYSRILLLFRREKCSLLHKNKEMFSVVGLQTDISLLNKQRHVWIDFAMFEECATAIPKIVVIFRTLECACSIEILQHKKAEIPFSSSHFSRTSENLRNLLVSYALSLGKGLNDCGLEWGLCKRSWVLNWATTNAWIFQCKHISNLTSTKF